MKSVSLKEEKKKKKKKVAVTATSKGLKFAKKQLKKHGWKKGKGLGKQENGISEALKVKMKCNTAGVGHNSAEEFTCHWWDHLFNSSAASITVEAGQDGVQVRKISKQDGPVTNKKPRRAQEGNMLYGRFVKAATLISGTEEPVSPTSTSDQEKEKVDLSTVRRGARHGLTMRAKLARLEEQEKAFLACSVQQKEGWEAAPSSGCPRLQYPQQVKRCKKSKIVGAPKKSQTEGACIKAKTKKKKKKKKKKKNAKEMHRH
ncbi:G patch domain-containing protein 4 isoform X2 [Candoia aspera]|uniref:G patch domain-containing protein 4 isoform X2 n=1 Tax=Candoia aspera TaxID=51853 RepID=UPI002FD7DB6F